MHGLKVNLKRIILYYNSSLDFVTLESRFPETVVGCGRMPELTTPWPDRSQNVTYFNSSRKNSINTGLRKEGDEMGNPALMERPGMLPIFYILRDTVCCWLHCLMWLVQEKIGHCLPNPEPSRWFLPHSLPTARIPAVTRSSASPQGSIQEVHYSFPLHLVILSGKAQAWFQFRSYWHRDQGGKKEKTFLEEMKSLTCSLVPEQIC